MDVSENALYALVVLSSESSVSILLACVSRPCLADRSTCPQLLYTAVSISIFFPVCAVSNLNIEISIFI